MIKKEKIMGELLYGIHPLVEAIKAGKRKIISIYTTNPKPKGWALIEPCLPKYHIPIQYVTRDVLTKMAQTTDHQAVVSWVTEFPFRKKPFEAEKHSRLLFLDGIQDSRNLGAILRSAYCTDVQGVILCKKNGAPLNATAIKASAGLSEHLTIYQAASPLQIVQELKQAGYTIYLATIAGQNALTVDFKKPNCLVIGGEGLGISREIRDQGIQVTIPQKTKDISYNASVAAGILLFFIYTKDLS